MLILCCCHQSLCWYRGDIAAGNSTYGHEMLTTMFLFRKTLQKWSYADKPVEIVELPQSPFVDLQVMWGAGVRTCARLATCHYGCTVLRFGTRSAGKMSRMSESHPRSQTHLCSKDIDEETVILLPRSGLVAWSLRGFMQHDSPSASVTTCAVLRIERRCDSTSYLRTLRTGLNTKVL